MTDAARTRLRIMPIAAVLVFSAFTVMNLRLIGSCIMSFAGSLALLALHPGDAPRLLVADAAEYWIAGIAWCAVPFLIVRAFMAPASVPTGRLARAARYTLAAFLFTALTAPIISPLPPLAQGISLQHDRHLAPLTLGVCWETLSVPPPARGDEGALDRAVDAANRHLLRRTTAFTGAARAHAGEPQAEPGAAVRRSSIVFIMGTDGVGRDILSRLIYGSRYSLGIGFVVVLVSLTLGSAAGIVSGYAGGFTDTVVMRVVDILFSIPSLILALMLMAFIGQSLAAMVVVLSATGWMGSARLLRGEVMHLRRREFISASILLGTPHADIIRRHIVPNVLPTIRNAGILQLGNIILAEASMTFLGLGIQQPEPSWGNMIADAMSVGAATPFAALFPAAALSALIISVHIVGEQPRLSTSESTAWPRS